MTIDEARRKAARTLAAAGIASSHLDATLLLEHICGKSRAWLAAYPDIEMSPKHETLFFELVKQRSQRTPLVHLTHSREFYGLDLYIDEHVLTPRIETERMAEWAIEYAPSDSRLIDIGTGSGALAIAIKKHRPDLHITATDISTEAIAVARHNCQKHGVEIELVVSDLFSNIDGSFKTVVTNLPYLRDDADLMPEVRREPSVALFGGTDGLELYRRFLLELPGHLEPNGLLFTECDPWQHQDLAAETKRYGLRPFKKDDYFILGFRRE